MKDFIHNTDLELKNGDFLVDNSDAQHVEFLLQSFQGEWKNHPTAGCNILNSKNASIDRMLKRNIEVQLEADGFKLQNLAITENGIQIKGNY